MVFAGQREKSYEYGLPGYLQHDLDMYKEGLKTHSNLLDCYWGELYGSINSAEIDDGAITAEHANYLRNKFLWGRKFKQRACPNRTQKGVENGKAL